MPYKTTFWTNKDIKKTNRVV